MSLQIIYEEINKLNSKLDSIEDELVKQRVNVLQKILKAIKNGR